MRVLVTGGRNYDNYRKVAEILTSVNPSIVAQGGANGADAMAQLWARIVNIPCITYKANWKEHGRAAGPIRNREMLADFKPDLVVAFPGGRGTADMVDVAEVNGVNLMMVTE